MIQEISISGIVLAAGKGTRMQSTLPKVLHTIAGKPMLEHVVTTLQQSAIRNICVVLNEFLEPFTPFMEQFPAITVCVQKLQNGTGGAAAAAAPAFKGVRPLPYAPSYLAKGQAGAASHVLICFGDTPALKAEILQDFMRNCLHAKSGLGILGMELDDPTGYGRLLTDATGALVGIVEEKDADADTKMVRVCNSGVIFAETTFLFLLLTHLTPNNSQNEYYITDCVRLARELGRPASLSVTKEWQSFVGVNTPQQLQSLEALLSSKKD